MDTSKQIEKQFLEFCTSTHNKGSNTPKSYVHGINMMNEVFTGKSDFLKSGETIWDIKDPEKLKRIYDFVKEEERKKKTDPDYPTILNFPNRTSYLRSRFCSSAIKNFAKFIYQSQIDSFEKDIFQKADEEKDSKQFEKAVTKRLKKLTQKDEIFKFEDEFFESDLSISSKEGIDVLRTVKTRLNQHTFHKLVFKFYGDRCCLTGLDIPDLLNASHIVPWREHTHRLDPANGLCLNALHDKAFDQGYITLDRDYRVVVSPTIADKDKEERKLILDYEGAKIRLPSHYSPSQEFLEYHRKHIFKS